MGHEAPEVVSAEAQKWAHDLEIDEGMKASLRFSGGRTGEILCSYAGDGSDGFVQPTAAGSARPLRDADGNFVVRATWPTMTD